MKKGQVSVFVVISIILLVLIALIFFFRKSISEAIREEPIDTEKYLAQQLNDIKKEIGRCVNKETDEASKILMENGGNFEKDFGYISYFGRKYPILCRDFEDKKGCLSEPILVSNLGEKLNNYLPENVEACLNLEGFKDEEYTLNLGEIKLDSEVFEDYILVNVDFPVKVTKDSYLVEEKIFIYSLNVPLGSLTKVANDLIQKKASGEEIDPILYGLLFMNKYKIEVRKPYPDELYDVSLPTKGEYHLYFAVEGTGRYERSSNII